MRNNLLSHFDTLLKGVKGKEIANRENEWNKGYSLPFLKVWGVPMPGLIFIEIVAEKINSHFWENNRQLSTKNILFYPDFCN